MDREMLILRAVGRIVDEALLELDESIGKIKREASAAGMLNSGSSVVAIANACASSFQKACVSVLEKVQLEDREGALELAGRVQNKTLKQARNRFAAVYVEHAIAPVPNPMIVDPNSTARFKARTEMDLRLQRIEGNVVDEFQLAITRQAPKERAQIQTSSFVHPDRISELKSKSSVAWDFSRLLAICDELNIGWQFGAHHSVAMLTRTMLDHVPPVFGQVSFAAVVANYGGSKSFKDSMEGLDKFSRKIADGHLHTQIRERESLPNSNQVDFRAGVDVLLAEIVRITP